MSDFHGPYYTVEEARDILGLRESELAHAIETGQLSLVVHTKARRMLVVGRDPDNNLIGYASCTYRGALRVPSPFALGLWDGAAQSLHAGAGVALEPTGISQWNNRWPFKRQPPHEPAILWRPQNQDALPPVLPLVPLPNEYQPFEIALYGGMARTVAANPTLAKGLAGHPLLNKAPPPTAATLRLDFASNSRFQPADLRIAASEIERYQAPPDEAPPAVAPVKERENQLHEVILRVIRQHPNASAKEVWRIMQKDFEEDSTFDPDGVITAMDANSIDWRSRHGNGKSLKWRSFQVQLGRLRASAS